ncbi:pseudouridine synthase [Aliamphritea ceti]|uniref:pseudouridine synthase n=1 Tax=Aliamphritea ceti TaxID=1524258 RepID=UPI0021C31487|nr:pseudouridine synthase [Aliamphritea ceti]
MTELNVLYEDDYLLAIDKPSGLLVHPSPIERRAENAVTLLREQRNFKAYTIHRLDRPTSGVLLFAKDPVTARAMCEQFAERGTEKTYLCVCRGYTEPAGVIDYPLKEELDKLADKFANADQEAKEAISAYRTLGQVELEIPSGKFSTSRYSLVEVKPRTGRKHQIRRHMKHIFHPIVGDTRHGDGRHNTLFREHFDLQRLLLLATDLSFRHPHTGNLMTVSAAPGQWEQSLFAKLGWQQLITTDDC